MIYLILTGKPCFFIPTKAYKKNIKKYSRFQGLLVSSINFQCLILKIKYKKKTEDKNQIERPGCPGA